MSQSRDPFFRVLCVDDDLQMQQALVMGLGMYGFEVITASDGLDALEQHQANAKNLAAIITDNHMPRMNGLEFVRAVREAGFKGRIVIMSGQLTAEGLRAYQPYAVSGYFQKPFEMSLLATMLLQAD